MKTIEVGTFEAKNKLSELLVKAARGQRILITRRGHGVAILCAPDADVYSTGARPPEALLARLRKFRNSAGTANETLKDFIEEGHR